MPISSVWSGPPVYSVISSVPSVAGAGATATVIADAGGAGGPSDIIVFSKVVWVYDARGAPTATYPVSVTLIGSVERKGAPTLLPEREKAELRPKTETVLEITTGEDPGVALGAPLATNDRVVWAGFTALVVGPVIPQGAGWLTKAVLTL
jgi:hypothetical protein